MQRVLRVDLSSGKYDVDTLPDFVEMEYIGGRGLGARLLYEHCPKGMDPLDSANPMIFSAGPSQGVGAWYSAKTVLTTKSPLTNIFLRSVSSGAAGINLRKAGYYALMITGKASEPTYLAVIGDRVELRSAEHLWGKKVAESQTAMLAETGLAGASVMGIGPAGEQGTMISCISSEVERYRSFGRGGAGAVMGSKNLKGVVIHGKNRLSAARPDDFARLKDSVRAFVKNNEVWAKRWTTHGTGADVITLSKLGLLPTRNWQVGHFDGAEGIDVAHTKVFQENPRKLAACGPNCPNPCSHYATVSSGPYAGATCRGPEYETIYAFGSNCGVDRMDAIMACSQICDEYGLDTMSAGVAVGFAMECYERGLISSKDADGLDLRFGNHSAMTALVRNIAENRGLGELLGGGVKRASQQIAGSDGFAMHTKGLELGGYEARCSHGQALAFAICSIGGSHGAMSNPARAEFRAGDLGKVEGRGQLLRALNIDLMLFDSAISCVFGGGPLSGEYIRDMIRAITGRELAAEDAEKFALRVIALERMFNVREGLGRADDTLPKRLTEEPVPSGATQGRTVNLEPLKDDGYAALGWGSDGIPTAGLLEELNLTDLIRRYS